MIKRNQTIKQCHHCDRVFEDQEEYWEYNTGYCYCTDNKCGWEDDEEDVLKLEEKERSC
jgi:hypothetical protein